MVDSWFILCALIAQCATCVQPHPAPTSNQPTLGLEDMEKIKYHNVLDQISQNSVHVGFQKIFTKCDTMLPQTDRFRNGSAMIFTSQTQLHNLPI